MSAYRTTYGYNPTTGQRISESNTQGKSKRLSYNPTGQVTHIWGDTDYPLHYVYNAYGERIEQHTYRGGSNWNSTSWPASTTGPADISLFVYQESSGLLTAKEDASAKSTTYSYYPGGLLHTRTWSRLNGSEALVTTYQYDPATAELTDVDYSDTTPDIHYGYYRHGGYQSISDALGSRDFLYNDDLQLLSETISGLYNRSIGRSYDQSTVKGRATGLQTDFGYAVSYGYEGTTGRFNSVSWDISSQTGSAVYTYQADSDLLHSLTSGSRETTYSYESDRDLLKTVLNRNNAQTVSEYSYQFDAIGRRKSRSTATDTKYFGYNDRSEVTAESYTENPAQSGNETTYSSNALNQYAGITGTQTATLSYDNDGNLISHKGMQYTYNAENRLISIIPSNPANNDRMLEFAYDYMGRRIEKKVSTWHDTEYLPEYTSYFVYDKWNLIEEIRQGQSYYYIWGLDLSRSLHGAGGIGGLLATVRNASTYQYFYDGNGNVSDVVNTGGPDLLGADDNPFRFSTKYLDLESGLYYYGYRYYSPELGRWMNRDPIGEAGGVNLYAMVGNNLIGVVDPWGLAKYNVFFDTASAGAGPYNYMEIEGWLVSLEKGDECSRCPGSYESIKFKGRLGGAGISLVPVASTTGNQEVFEDDSEKPNVRNIEGVSSILAGAAVLSNDKQSGFSGGMYNFGYMTGTNESLATTEGYDFGIDALIGYTWTIGDIVCKLNSNKYSPIVPQKK